MFLRRIQVADHERVLLIRNGRFHRLLGPGSHLVWNLGKPVYIERHSVRKPEFISRWADVIYFDRPDIARRHFIVIETNDAQVASVYVDGKLARMLLPNKRRMFWRGPLDVTAQIVKIIASPADSDDLAEAPQPHSRQGLARAAAAPPHR